ncbi:MAG: DNA primase [Patescibacteria group bacterium]|uniref:DNA primase n=1 Tax=candidate division WWE3 bacterium TaxID=2053526 RepID=A0A955J1M3_UNCKA|nr:DNA primase [candidate division WWE3 bacterium]
MQNDPIEEIKQRLDIADVIGGYVSLKKSGRNYKGNCPFHGEKTPSFMVSPDMQIYKCFGCGKGGDIFSFIKEVEGVEFNQALKILAEKAGVTLTQTYSDPNSEKKELIFKLNSIAAQYYSYILLQHSAGKEALTYVKSHRKLKPKTIEEFKIGYAPSQWGALYDLLVKKGYSPEIIEEAGLCSKKSSGIGYIDRFRNRIMFPLIDINGKIVGFSGRIFDPEDKGPKYMNTSDTLVFNKSAFVYGLDKARLSIKQEGAIFVEGYMDVISAHQAGLNNVVAVSGTALTQTQLKILSRYTKDLTFAFDSDSAGINAVFRAVDLAERDGFNLNITLFPKKYKDLDEYLQEKTKSDAKELFKNSLSVYDFFLLITVKNQDKNTAAGKRAIVNELSKLFKQLRDPITIDHYSKRVAEILNIDEHTIREAFTSGKVLETSFGIEASSISTSKDYFAVHTVKLSKESAESYMLALLLKADLDISQTIVYKLGQRDFTNPAIQDIFKELKEYLLGRKRKFEISHFKNRFKEETAELVSDLYLWDVSAVTDSEEIFLRELDTTYKRLKTVSLKRELKSLAEKIKQAELTNDAKALKLHQNKFKELSQKLK